MRRAEGARRAAPVSADRQEAPAPASKRPSLVGGMAAGADSIADMGLLRHSATCSPARTRPTLGLLLRATAFGHVRSWTAVTLDS